MSIWFLWHQGPFGRGCIIVTRTTDWRLRMEPSKLFCPICAPGSRTLHHLNVLKVGKNRSLCFAFHRASPIAGRCSECSRLLGSTRRRLDISSSPSASLAHAPFSLGDVHRVKPTICGHFQFELWTANRQNRPAILRNACFSPDLWTPTI
jgi:hypothetical protein